MTRQRPHLVIVAILAGLAAIGIPACADTGTAASGSSHRPSTTRAAAPEPTIPKPANVYGGIGADHLQSRVAGDLPRVYVPNGGSNTVSVIDPATDKVVDTMKVGRQPQHIVPSWDLRTLWVLDNSGDDLIPINPKTGQRGARIPVADPYNLYFTPDGSSAIVVAEAAHRLDFRDPQTMALQSSLEVPGCKGINHADYSADASYMIVTCEFAGAIAKIDMVNRRVVGLLHLGSPMSASGAMPAMAAGDPPPSMPQDVRVAPDGRQFYVADMMAGGLHIIDGDTFTVTGFIPTGIGTHGITPARDGRRFFIANRGSPTINGSPHGPGSISVLDTTTNTVTATWPIPGGGSPDMGNASADGTQLWLSGRFDNEVYDIDTTTGALLARIPVGKGPHGLTVWPQPGSFSLGHTGNMR